MARERPNERLRPPPNRRRDKPQLSCNMCRLRCDRQQPCKTCVSRGLGLSCAYSPDDRAVSPSSGHTQQFSAPRGTVPDRIVELERLVISLMGQVAPRKDGNAIQLEKMDDSDALLDIHTGPPDFGKISQDSRNYVGSAHWTAIFDSIAELKMHFETEHQSDLQPPNLSPDPTRQMLSGPQLLYGCLEQVSYDQILAAIPPRSVVDRLIARYFNALDMAPALLHSGQFLRLYEKFWEAPSAAPIIWIGLLFTMMCLATLSRPSSTDEPRSSLASLPSRSASSIHHAVQKFREKAVQCLFLGQYTKPKPYVLETLILYLAIEHYLCEDAEFGVYIVLGITVHLAMRMGYHRDAKHFPDISPFEGEMRRRVWATIRSVDLGVSAQVGLPRMIQTSQVDTAEPRNLLDSDLDENSSTLPLSRPDAEVTPVLYVVAKCRIETVCCAILDFTTGISPRSQAEVMAMDRQLQDARRSLPSSLVWQSLAHCITDSPQIIFQRIWLEMSLQHCQISLHRRYYLTPDAETAAEQRLYSRNACLNSAIRILEFQALIDDEIQPDGQLYQVRWRVSSLLNHNFLLATSILCSSFADNKNEALSTSESFKDSEEISAFNIRQLLYRSLNIWTRASSSSKEAHRAAQVLRHVLQKHDGTESATSTTSSGQPNWFENDDADYDDTMANSDTPFNLLQSPPSSMPPDSVFPGLSPTSAFLLSQGQSAGPSSSHSSPWNKWDTLTFIEGIANNNCQNRLHVRFQL
ncbi:hypothetical protein B0H63DRAFT_391849 [Podospora didyma]|uniref:Xylanolytic transcriptional activator regulatory domain-containing protein n=1 Tax=Podospora didyma TaxID=330526 RepID=A0AAE0U0R9_9PEZI|nr:hypothetical protein B0H63DRAFT_391849 [Podospora didyma]